MELLPTLRAQLEGLEEHLDDPEVHEILIAGPDRVFVTRGGRSERLSLELSERRIRALADRLLRALGGRPDRHEVRAGRLSDALEVSIVGTPRQERCPVVRVHRGAHVDGKIDELRQRGLLSTEVASAVEALVRGRRSAVVVAPFGAPRERLIVALARAWAAFGRVVALDREGGALAEAGCADLVFPPGTPVEGLLAVAPDVVVALDPSPTAWTGLLESGRPVLVAVEAPDAEAGLERLVGLALSGDARLSRAAAESLVLGVGGLLELAAGRTLWLRRVLRPVHGEGRPSLTSVAEQAAPAFAEPTPASAPEDTSSFPAAALVEELSNEIAEAEAAMRGAAPPDAAPSEPAEPPLAPEALVPDEHTRFASAVSRPPEGRSRSTSPEPADEAPSPAAETRALPPRRIASERMATVTGPPRPSEVASQIRHVLDELSDPGLPAVEADEADEGGEEPEAEVTSDPAAQADFEEELRTSHVVAPPDLDPFETHEASFEPSVMDSTQAAEIGEMLSGEVSADPRVLDVPPQPTLARRPPEPDEEDWDEEAPSELIDRAELPSTDDGEGDPPEGKGPFEDEKTPVAPLFDKTPRASRRPRRRPRSAEDGGRDSSAADDIGDPTRRRKDTPERPRGGRRRQRDRS